MKINMIANDCYEENRNSTKSDKILLITDLALLAEKNWKLFFSSFLFEINIITV